MVLTLVCFILRAKLKTEKNVSLATVTVSQGVENNFRLNLSIPTIVMVKVRFPELVDVLFCFLKEMPMSERIIA